MRLSVTVTQGHRGKFLEVDCEQETITLLGLEGQQMGTLPWESIIDQILALRPPKSSKSSKEARTEPRVFLSVKVRYSTSEGKRFEGRAGGIGGGGLFIERTSPLPVGTKLKIEFALPERPSEWLEAKGTVAWVCPKADQYTFSPGMGVRFTEISTDVRGRVVELVRSLRRTGRSARSA
jgi:type IV pilus assembly protein PilZ